MRCTPSLLTMTSFLSSDSVIPSLSNWASSNGENKYNLLGKGCFFSFSCCTKLSAKAAPVPSPIMTIASLSTSVSNLLYISSIAL